MDAKKRYKSTYYGRYCFNPRARDGRELRTGGGMMQLFSFNPRARDGREVELLVALGAYSGFNPRARDGRESQERRPCQSLWVSIHAPVMDAKRFRIHSQIAPSFNPRARDGREFSALLNTDELKVSIHAPVMDAKS